MPNNRGFLRKVNFFKFKAYQKQVLQSFVQCLILVTRWTQATHNLQGSYSTYITEWDYNFFFSLPQNALHTSDSGLSCISTSCVLWRIFEQTPQLKWSACSPLSTLSSELHWATDRQRKKTRQKMQMNSSTLLHVIQNHHKKGRVHLKCFRMPDT